MNRQLKQDYVRDESAAMSDDRSIINIYLTAKCIKMKIVILDYQDQIIYLECVTKFKY